MVDDETAPVDAARQAQSRAIAADRSTTPLTPGTRLGRFELKDLLGRGGFSLVYAAHDTDAGRDVALKVLREPDGWRSASAQRRAFLHESKALAQLRHPGIVRVYDAGVLEGHPIIVMEKVEGEPLEHWLAAGRSPSAVVECWLALCDAVAAAHGVSIVHRDLKPSNVIVTGRGAIKLLDFGLARSSTEVRTASSVVFGSGGYTAPERLRGDPGGPAGDQYALAVMLAVGLGAPVPTVGTPPQLDADVVTPLREALSKALAEDPTHRFESVRALAEAVRDASASRRGWVFGVVVVAAVLAALIAVAAR